MTPSRSEGQSDSENFRLEGEESTLSLPVDILHDVRGLSRFKEGEAKMESARVAAKLAHFRHRS
jgi:hypothetical protein